MRNRIGVILAFVVACLVLVILLSVWMFPWNPIDYHPENPGDSLERENLIAKLRTELKDLERQIDNGSYMNDSDRLWPADRIRIVLAIQEFRVAKHANPSGWSELVDSGFLDVSKVEHSYRIETSDDNWTVLSSANYKLAVGN